MKLKNSDSSPAASLVQEKLKKSLYFALASSGVSLVLLAPLMVSASIFSIPALLASLTKETAAASGSYNSQTVPVLTPAHNIDPKPSIGGGDITMVGGSALLAEEGPSGTAADIENAPPEATAISVYTVHKGDTLAGIAKMFGVSVNTIKGANTVSNGIREGDTLIILPITGLPYTVQKGDTLASIAKKFKADAEEVSKYNDLGGNLAVGTKLIIPDGELVAPVVAKSSTKTTTANLYRGGAGPDLGGYYTWPVNGGVLTQGLHGYNGIDIGAPTGTGILSAAAGTVIIANGNGGWNGGYGNYVVIQHDNGTQTLYGHASKVYVTAGQRVAQGATIGAVGRTGKATGPHLHFEVRGATNPFNK